MSGATSPAGDSAMDTEDITHEIEMQKQVVRDLENEVSDKQAELEEAQERLEEAREELDELEGELEGDEATAFLEIAK
jgi:Skp family chaperone for outer membrane proteins